MIVRERSSPETVWPRFRSRHDVFKSDRRGGLVTSYAHPGAERAVDLFHALTEHLPPAVAIEVEDVRAGVRWEGTALALVDVRDALARLKVSLVAFGGARISVWCETDQVALSPMLELWCVSRYDRWAHLLLGMGLREVKQVRLRAWQLTGATFPHAPEASTAMREAAASLGLRVS